MRTESPSNLTYYYQDNHEGSVTHLMLANGTVIESYRYDAFGAPTITTAQGYSPNNRFMFTGREYIKQFGIYEYRARAYHPGIGRFMSEDPKGFDAGDYNLFRYCKNDPLDLTDPMGLATAPLTSPIGAQQDKNNKYYKLHPSAFTSQLLDGPGVPSTNGTGGPWQSSRNFTMATAQIQGQGQFQVSARPVSATSINGVGASASDVRTTFKSNAGFPSYHIEQEVRDPRTHGQFVKDVAYEGLPGFTTEHFKNGVTIHDFPGKVVPEIRAAPGNPIPRRGGTYAVAQFKPFTQTIRAIAFGDRGGTSTRLGSYTWSATYAPNSAPRYQGANDGWHPADF